MTVRLGEVQVKVTLDFAEEKKKIEELKKSVQREEKTRKETVQKIVKEERQSSGTASKTVLESFIQRKVARMTAANEAAGMLVGAAGRAQGLLPEGAGAALKTVGVAAAVYAGTSAAAKAAPTVLELLKQFLPEAMKDSPAMGAVMGELEKLRAAFTYMESTVLAMASAVGQTSEIASASLRLGGQVPSLSHYYEQSRSVESQERQLREKFKREQNDQVAAGLGASLNKALMQSFNGGK